MRYTIFFSIIAPFVIGLLITSVHGKIANKTRSFEIDYDNNQFLKDGKPFQYKSGSLHYFRIPRAYWKDRLQKYKAAGLNAIQTYIEWSSHEPLPGKYDFKGINDFVHFFKLAQQEGLLVILRPGPYICAERDLGGYPAWIFHDNPNVKLRTQDRTHIKPSKKWLKVLFKKIKPLLYGNGGPIIMVQVENEYGSYPLLDEKYKIWLRDELKKYVGDKAVLFTTDSKNDDHVKKGKIEDVFATIDFGPDSDAKEMFDLLRQTQTNGPLVNSEFYPGWLTHWGEPYEEVGQPTAVVISAVEDMLQMNASFNFYMFHGGTNFGLTAGANNPPYEPQLTSYDYGAPISESGNLTEKYYAIQTALLNKENSIRNNIFEIPPPVSYGTVALEYQVSLFDSGTGIDYGATPYPQTFEELKLYSGLMMYETTLPKSYKGKGYLVANNVHDMAIVFHKQKRVGVFSRMANIYSMLLAGKGGDTLGLLVENQGHINFDYMNDTKGLIENVTLAGETLTNWKHTGYPLTKIPKDIAFNGQGSGSLPAFFSGTLNISKADATFSDTFVDMTGWGKGVIYVNGFMLGRYWPVAGPQITLYLPGTLLKRTNIITLLEYDLVNPNKTVYLRDTPILGVPPS